MKDNEMPLGERGFWYEKGDGGNFIRADPDAHIDVFEVHLVEEIMAQIWVCCKYEINEAEEGFGKPHGLL